MVVITIVIILRSCGEDGSEKSVTTTPRATTSTTSTTLAPVTTPPPTDPAPPPVETLPPEVVEALASHCVQPPADGGDPGEALAGLLEGDLTVVKGPAEGEVPSPLGSGDPALEFERAGGLVAPCDTHYPVVVVDLGGVPERVQVGVAFDYDPAGGRTANPTAPEGLGRIAGWDTVIFLESDGITNLSYDYEFRPAGIVADVKRFGDVLVVALDEVVVDTFVWYVQTFRRDGATAQDPVDWAYVNGSAALSP